MDNWNPRANEIFVKALAFESSDDRQGYLDEACGADADLRNEVESLLKADAQAGSFLDSPGAIAPTLDVAPIAEEPGTKIGRYRLVHEIGHGGMGVVYMAVQKEPVKRKVALKIIKPGMDTREVVKRFEGERQALALMDHQSIAKVLDGGSTESGRPYFVMELVEGTRITEFCDQARYNTRQRLELFGQVCRAVQHAHQKGIIHRDLKPSNILVTNYDQVAVPKVIDFGIAKAVHQPLTDQSVYTNVSQMIGTPLYMSPEQAQRSGLDIDTRTDVYSLGVLLYELLSGTTPFEKVRLQNSSLDEVKRIIREEDPPRPSTRVSTLNADQETVAKRHSTNLRALSHELSGELDWIVMKALEKDRTRRYESASDFAKDIQRYLDDDPVEACPPTRAYRFGKFARRNKTAFTTTALVALALVVGTGVATWQAIRAHRHAVRADQQTTRAESGEKRAEAQARRAERGEQRAEQEAEKAREEAATSEAVLQFLNEDLLAQTSPLVEPDRNIKLRTVLDRASTKIADRFEGQPLVSARIHVSLGDAFLALGESGVAVQHFENAASSFVSERGPDHPFTLAVMGNLARAHRAAGHLAVALPLYEETFQRMRESLGREHRLTLVAMHNLGSAYNDAGRTAEALQLIEETRSLMIGALGTEHDDTLSATTTLARIHQQAGKAKKALPLFEETLKIRQQRHGTRHPYTLSAMRNVANSYRASGRLAEAIGLYEEVRGLQVEILEPDHPNSLSLMSDLAGAYRSVGRVREAIPLLEEALARQREALDRDHPSTLETMSDLALTYRVAGRMQDAIELGQTTLELRREKLGLDHPLTLVTMGNLVVAYAASSRFHEAIELGEELLDLSRNKNGMNHRNTLNNMNSLAIAYLNIGRTADAVSLLKEAVERQRQECGPDEHQTLVFTNNLARAYLRIEQPEEALPLLEHIVAAHRRLAAGNQLQLAVKLTEVGVCLVEHSQYSAAEPYMRECLAIREHLMPDDWLLIGARLLLGKVLAGQAKELMDTDKQVTEQKFAEAAALIVSALEGMKQAAAANPTLAQARIRVAAGRLVDLYTAWGKPDEAAKWQRLVRDQGNEQPPDKAGSKAGDPDKQAPAPD